MEGIIFKKESIADVYREIRPLLIDHFEEVEPYQDIKLDPNFFSYNKLESQESFVLFTARCDGELIGYSAFFLQRNLHYQTSFQAVQDAIFIDKRYRGKGLGTHLIDYCDNRLKEMTVQVVYHHVKVAHNFGPLLEDLGYEHLENIYGKRLDSE